MPKPNLSVRELTCAALCIALSLLLSYVPALELPQGGAITACSMFFAALAGYWFGPGTGLISCVALGLLHLLLKGYAVHPAQVLLDYPLAFGALGVSGFFRRMKHGLSVGYLAGVFGRYIFTFLSGVVFFASYAPEGQHPAIYSAVYNLMYLGPEALITLIIINIPVFRRAVERVGEYVKK